MVTDLPQHSDYTSITYGPRRAYPPHEKEMYNTSVISTQTIRIFHTTFLSFSPFWYRSDETPAVAPEIPCPLPCTNRLEVRELHSPPQLLKELDWGGTSQGVCLPRLFYTGLEWSVRVWIGLLTHAKQC